MEKNFKILEDDKNQSRDDFYAKFKDELNKVHTFPAEYMFKYVSGGYYKRNCSPIKIVECE